MEASTNLLEELMVFFVVGSGRAQPDNVKNRAQVLWMDPKSDYFLRFDLSTASTLPVTNGYSGKPFEPHFMFLKNLDRTSLL